MYHVTGWTGSPTGKRRARKEAFLASGDRPESITVPYLALLLAGPNGSSTPTGLDLGLLERLIRRTQFLSAFMPE